MERRAQLLLRLRTVCLYDILGAMVERIWPQKNSRSLEQRDFIKFNLMRLRTKQNETRNTTKEPDISVGIFINEF